MTEDQRSRDAVGPNDWLVDEMYHRYLDDPSSVSESWQEFFEDYRPRGTGRRAERDGRPPVGDGERRGTTAVKTPRPEPEDGKAEPEADGQQAPEGAAPLAGPGKILARNMEASLHVPTATSVRDVPAKLLEENRRVLNEHLSARGGGKVSFTHLVGWAIVRALKGMPNMNVSYTEVNGEPHIVHHKRVALGLAVDVERKDGSRNLLVPNVKEADQLDFAGFHAAYEDAIRKVRTGKLSPADFDGTTATLTNPGMIGTSMSVPRLMRGQGVIIGCGSIDYPVEYRGSDPATLATLGIGKVMTVTSTYDHRVIQGAESGEFLDLVSDLLCGENRFYEELFESLAVPYEPIRWSTDRGVGLGAGTTDATVEKNGRVLQLIHMYRVRGHLIADLNPLVKQARSHLELDPGFYDLGVWDLDRTFWTNGLGGKDRATLREILGVLRDAYCRTAGIEYMHIQEADEKRWIQQRVEGRQRDPAIEDKRFLLERLNTAEAFERFLHTKYIGHKRFSLEGAESLIPMLSSLLDDAADAGMGEAVIGMAHRGRLNVRANIIGKSFAEIFREFEGDIDPQTTQGSGDVKYHLGAKGTWTSREGHEITTSVASNPSHLEAVNPVVEGIVRARQDLAETEESQDAVLPILIHGDAAFAGQGVVQETLNLSQLPGYKTGGTVHVVVNNGLGFTAGPESTRSSVYATDVAKMVQAPIFHVNGDDPEACVWVMQLAFAYRQAFHKDVVVDLVCYRRHGHNEADEPAFTQPLMYAQISEQRSVRKLYTETLVNRGDISLEEAEEALEDFRERLQGAFDETKQDAPPEEIRAKPPPPPRGPRPAIDTGVDRELLERVARTQTDFPDGFEPHPKLAKLLAKHAGLLEEDSIDWPLAEAFAWGSLIVEGTLVRLSGQDSRRGTFSQRHSVLIDHRTGDEHVPLNTLSENGGRLRIYDSLLSEFAAVGFEYGYAVGNKDALVQWEAQFGDFINGAQIVLDQYVVAAEDKWDQTCGVVLLLPHGYEGQGPEHSSARLERFLTLCAEDNIQVAYPTKPAQYFHLLRRQIHMDERKPLIVLTPKSLLRHPAARSSTDEFTSGHFREVLGDVDDLDAEVVERVILCSGKVAVDVSERRRELEEERVAVVRVEQLYPFPHVRIDEEVQRYPNAKTVYWLQEEPENMGAWGFVYTRLSRQLPDIQLIARLESASPATGSHTVHEQEQEELLEAVFEGLS